MSDLEESLKDEFTKEELFEIVTEIGALTVPRLTNAIYRAIDLHNAGAIQRAMLAVGISQERAALAAPNRKA